MDKAPKSTEAGENHEILSRHESSQPVDQSSSQNQDEHFQKIQKSDAQGLVDSLLGHHLSLALGARSTEEQLLEIEEQARKVCVEAGFSEQEIAGIMRRFEDNRSWDTSIRKAESAPLFSNYGREEEPTKKIEPETMLAHTNEYADTAPATQKKQEHEQNTKAPKLGLGARLRVWASSALLGRSKEVGQKIEEAKIMKREEQERTRRETEYERARSKSASSWLLRAWNKSIYDMTPERTEEIARAKRDERLQKKLESSVPSRSGGLLGKIARTAVLGGVIASLPSEKLADPKMKALEAFSNPTKPTTEYAMTTAPRVGTPKPTEQKVKKVVVAPIPPATTVSSNEVTPSLEKKIKKRADSSSKETSVKKPRIAKRLNYHPGKEPFATEAPLLVSLEDLYAHDIESTVQIDSVTSPRYEKYVLPVSRFEGVEQAQITHHCHIR